MNTFEQESLQIIKGKEDARGGAYTRHERMWHRTQMTVAGSSKALDQQRLGWVSTTRFLR